MAQHRDACPGELAWRCGFLNAPDNPSAVRPSAPIPEPAPAPVPDATPPQASLFLLHLGVRKPAHPRLAEMVAELERAAPAVRHSSAEQAARAFREHLEAHLPSVLPKKALVGPAAAEARALTLERALEAECSIESSKVVQTMEAELMGGDPRPIVAAVGPEGSGRTRILAGLSARLRSAGHAVVAYYSDCHDPAAVQGLGGCLRDVALALLHGGDQADGEDAMQVADMLRSSSDDALDDIAQCLGWALQARCAAAAATASASWC